jgi:outer membrane receptor protein involved in Fe transport
VTPIVRTRGGELGLRTEIVPRACRARWRCGSCGSAPSCSSSATPARPRRHGRAGAAASSGTTTTASRPWLLLDADLALSRARFSDRDPAGNRIPGTVGRVASLGVSVLDLGRWFGHFQLRHFGPRPLVEDDSRRSKATTLAYLRLGVRIGAQARLALDVFNLFDREASDIDYFYASRLRGEPAGGVADVHFHPVEPRRFRLSLTSSF